MIKRTSIEYINKFLDENSNLNVLDIGCGYTANRRANTIADVQDFSSYYPQKKFVKIKEKKLPFKDNEFDFVIASHVIEHVEDFEFFLKELERISPKGYIELPSRLGDNLVFENVKEHIWWFIFDDIKSCLVASKRNQSISPFLSVSSSKKFDNLFRESMVLELLWENKIDYIIDSRIKNLDQKKISFPSLIKKYFSKLIRKSFSRN